MPCFISSRKINSSDECDLAELPGPILTDGILSHAWSEVVGAIGCASYGYTGFNYRVVGPNR